jgi:uncharacterized protein YjbJ (UPF0337 family)
MAFMGVFRYVVEARLLRQLYLRSVGSRTEAGADAAYDDTSASFGDTVLSTAIYWSIPMNKDQIKGAVTDIAGKAEEAAGKAIGNTEMQVKGLHKQAVGNAEKAIGEAKEGVKHVSDAIKHAAKNK